MAVPYQILVSFCIRTTRWLAARRGPEWCSLFTSSILFFPSFSRYRPLYTYSAEFRLTLPPDVYWLPCRRVSRENEGNHLQNTCMLGFGSSAASDSIWCLLVLRRSGPTIFSPAARCSPPNSCTTAYFVIGLLGFQGVRINKYSKDYFLVCSPSDIVASHKAKDLHATRGHFLFRDPAVGDIDMQSGHYPSATRHTLHFTNPLLSVRSGRRIQLTLILI